MDQNRHDIGVPGRFEADIFDAFGEDDSIVERLLSMPVAPGGTHDGVALWEAGIARRVEVALAKRMREKIEAHR